MSEFEKILILILVIFGAAFELCLMSIAIDISAIRKKINTMQKHLSMQKENPEIAVLRSKKQSKKLAKQVS